MKITPMLKDCAGIAAAEGFTHLWVTVACGTGLSVGDVVGLADLISLPSDTYESPVGELKIWYTRRPFYDKVIQRHDLLARYGVKAQAIADRRESESESHYAEVFRAMAQPAIDAIRADLLACFRSYGQEPSTADLSRCKWTLTDFHAAAQSDGT